MVPLIGYVDRFSARPGERIAVKVSSQLGEPYQADLVRIVHGDPNPAGFLDRRTSTPTVPAPPPSFPAPISRPSILGSGASPPRSAVASRVPDGTSV